MTYTISCYVEARDAVIVLAQGLTAEQADAKVKTYQHLAGRELFVDLEDL